MNPQTPFSAVNLPDFAATVRQQIPLLDAMNVDFIDYNGSTLSLGMPLAPNINDKQTGFGGSLAALATACGWAMVSLVLKDASLEADVVVVKSDMRFLAPVTTDCLARVEWPSVEKKQFLQQLSMKGRARTELVLDIVMGEEPVANCRAIYLARLK
ncbi:MAG: hypothetical protein COB19_03335 [Porticoccus sp.]|nr:MAG: hypothetical protein COB19_03335 [Porticoccus sp.]